MVLGEGTTNRVHDTQWRILVKIVMSAWTKIPGLDPLLLPTDKDTRWKLKEKWQRILVAAGGLGPGPSPGTPRVTEEGDLRITEEGDVRFIES